MKKPIIIIVEGGIVQNVYGPRGSYIVVDHDEEAEGEEYELTRQPIASLRRLTNPVIKTALWCLQ